MNDCSDLVILNTAKDPVFRISAHSRILLLLVLHVP